MNTNTILEFGDSLKLKEGYEDVILKDISELLKEICIKDMDMEYWKAESRRLLSFIEVIKNSVSPMAIIVNKEDIKTL